MPRNVHVDKALTNMSIAFINQQPYVWTQFPSITNVRESDIYWEWDKAYWGRIEAAKRARGKAARKADYKGTTKPFLCDEWALAHDIFDRDVNDADDAINLPRQGMEFVTDNVMKAFENDSAGKIMAAGIWDNDVTPGVLWSTPGTATPINDIDLGRNTIRRATNGYEPNTLICGSEAWDALRLCDQLTDLYKHTTGGVLTQELVARALGLERIIVCKTVKNTDVEKVTSTYTGAAIWDTEDTLLCYLEYRPAKMKPSAFYLFKNRDMRIRRWYEDATETETVESSIIGALNVTATSLGYYFDEAVA